MKIPISTSAEDAVGLEPGGPREDEHGLDVEHARRAGRRCSSGSGSASSPCRPGRRRSRRSGTSRPGGRSGRMSEPRPSTPASSPTATPPKIATVRYDRRKSDTTEESSDPAEARPKLAAAATRPTVRPVSEHHEAIRNLLGPVLRADGRGGLGRPRRPVRPRPADRGARAPGGRGRRRRPGPVRGRHPAPRRPARHPPRHRQHR